MGSRWFNSAVVLFWLSSMTWLTVAKVLPPLRRGDPPSFSSIYLSTDAEALVPVGWQTSWNGRQIGWAVTRIDRSAGGAASVENRVHFDGLPLEEMAPAWMRAVLAGVIKPLGRLEIDATSRMEIDPLGKLSSFRSTVHVADYPDVMRVFGTVDGSNLNLRVETASFSRSTTWYLPADALLADELSPQSRMPNLRVGQRWTVPVYSPLRPPTSPLEILEAHVVRSEPIIWNGEALAALVVVYQTDSGAGLRSDNEPLGKLWVAPDGRVVKQEINLFGSPLAFHRLSDVSTRNILRQFDEAGAASTNPRPAGRSLRPRRRRTLHACRDPDGGSRE